MVGFITGNGRPKPKKNNICSGERKKLIYWQTLNCNGNCLQHFSTKWPGYARVSSTNKAIAVLHSCVKKPSMVFDGVMVVIVIPMAI